MKKYFVALLLLSIVSLVEASYLSEEKPNPSFNLGGDFLLVIDIEKQAINFYSDNPVQQLDIGVINLGTGSVITSIEKNISFGAGSSGYSGMEVNTMLGFNKYTPESIVGFTWACTGSQKATGLIASFRYDCLQIPRGAFLLEDYDVSGVGAFVQFADMEIIDINNTPFPIIPEPITLSLFGLGAAIVVRRRKLVYNYFND